MTVPDVLTFSDREIPLIYRPSLRARRVTLRLDSVRGSVIITLPLHIPLRIGFEFAQSKVGWIFSHLPKLNTSQEELPLKISFLGNPYHVIYTPQIRGNIHWGEEQTLHVTGDPHHYRRRLKDFLKTEFSRELSLLIAQQAHIIGIPKPAMTLRDTRSRWGSCSTSGRLNFSWRLALSPLFVIEYVVAHEMAHLKEMNHSHAFWKQVECLVPKEQIKRATQWLKHHGATLHQL